MNLSFFARLPPFQQDWHIVTWTLVTILCHSRDTVQTVINTTCNRKWGYRVLNSNNIQIIFNAKSTCCLICRHQRNIWGVESSPHVLQTLVSELSLANSCSSVRLSLTSAVFPKRDAVVALHKMGTLKTVLVFKPRFWKFRKSRVQAQNADRKHEGPRSRHLGK